MASRAALSRLFQAQGFYKTTALPVTRRCICTVRKVRAMKPVILKPAIVNSSERRNLSTENSEVEVTEEPDILYRAIDVYVKGHEDAVLESYAKFATIAADELGIKVAGILKPKMILDRVTLLRSVFVHKKHRVQYEAQTHKRVIQLKYLTGSTANAYLSYLQINIPAGVAMHVHKWSIERLPEHLEEAMAANMDRITPEDEAVAAKFRTRMAEDKTTTNSDYEEYHTTKPYLIGTHG